ncbi:hypothetical protein F5Y03DRAFT_372923 [Xylaria venustula]|nr:hypothetical protein F5Y03DRAFT_372923 [Xylaria venustula]
MSTLVNEKASVAPAFSSQRTSGSIWQAALDRYYDELRKGGIKDSLIEKDLWNVETPADLVVQIEVLTPSEARGSKTWLNALGQLQPILLGLNDFAALVAWSLGLDGKVAALIWGSIRLMIKFAQPVLPDLLDMLGELQRALPRIQKYENELPMTDTLERALLYMYSEIIVFCAHAVAFFWNNPNPGRSRNAWSQFNRDFVKVVSNLRGYARRVDEVADMIRLSRETQSSQTLSVLTSMRKLRASNLNIPCYNIPYGLNLRFFGRENQITTLRESLNPKEGSQTMKVVAIQGLGGVGKTQLALQYANTSLKMFDIIIWIPAETQIKIIQTLARYAAKLGLSSEEGTEDDYQSVQKLRDWLNTIEDPFLLIFDNVEDADLLEKIWPASTNASIIITTRSPSVANRRTTNVIALQCFEDDTGTEVLCALAGRKAATEEDVAAAREITQLLGGLPLALVQVSTFITDRNCLYEEFLTLYKKSALKVLARSKGPGEYDYNSLTAWNMSLEKLSGEARVLQNVLAFFDPDLILERLIVDTKADLSDDKLQFLFDEFDFGDAVMELTRAALVTRIASSKALSIHRLIQLSVFRQLPVDQRVYYFDVVVQVLYHDFPNTWAAKGPYQGHGYKSWETCSSVLVHVNWLMSLSRNHKVLPKFPATWAELIFRAGTYLWEKEQPTLARSFFEYGLDLNIDKNSVIAAQAFRLLGHISLDLARPRAALKAYQDALAARRQIEKPESPPIADVYDSIACSLTEIGNVVEATEYLNRAMAIHAAHDPLKRCRTEAIRALTFLRAGQPDKSLEALQVCWGLQGLTQEQVEASDYPKHSGDIVLLARIYWMQGEKERAQELTSRTISIRKGLFGQHGGPRVADSIFQLAWMLQDRDKDVLAAKLLNEIVDISGTAVEMRGHLARGLWFLSTVERKLGSPEQRCEELKHSARHERARIIGREGTDEDTDESFMSLVSWMLW